MARRSAKGEGSAGQAAPVKRPILVVTGSAGGGTPGPGGWGYVVCFPSGQEVEAGGTAPDTTTSRMALTAVVRALERLSTERVGATAVVRVVSSSQYAVDGASGKAERRSNLDLWTHLDQVAAGRRVLWEWEPDETMYLQERAAELARLAMKRGATE
jgi:ribonuclease HI